MKVVVTGARGMLAHALVPALAGEGADVVALDRAALDVTDPEAVERVLGSLRPEVVVQCAAYTAVDRAETEEATAFRANALGTRHVASVCQRMGSLLVYPSTDYVFSGETRAPYRPGDPTGPLNAYGRSKLAGEEEARRAGRALIVRTSWLYGPGGGNFVDSILRLAAQRPYLEVVDDQWGRPTWTRTLTGVLLRLLKMEAEGTFHATDAGESVTWFDFAAEIVRQTGTSAEIRPISSERIARPAARPRVSVLDCGETERAIGEALPDWRASLERHLSEGLG